MSSPVDDLIENFAKAVYGKHEHIQSELAKQAELGAPFLRDAMQDSYVEDKAGAAATTYVTLMETFDAEETAEKLHAIAREEIDGVVEKFLSYRPPHDEQLANARSVKTSVLAMTEEDHIVLAEAIDSVLPSGLKTAERAARGGVPVAEAERQARALAQSLPDSAVAEALTQQQERLSRDAITDSLYDFLQQITPGQLQKLHNSLKENIEGALIGVLVKRGWVATLEIFEAAEAGNCLKPAQPKRVQAFGRTLNETLCAVEDALAEANITLPPVLYELFSQIDSARVLRSAKAIADANSAHNGITAEVPVGRPLRFKAPKR